MYAEHILKTSDLLIPENCKIIDKVLYEKLVNHPEGLKYRFFLSEDDYDYVEDQELITQLDKAFEAQ